MNSVQADFVTSKPTSKELYQYFIQNDPHVDLANNNNQLMEISRLSDMIYQPAEWIDKSVPASDFNAFRAMCNQIICAEHRYELPVRALLSDMVIKNGLTKVGRIVRSFKKYCVVLLPIKKAFQMSNDFKKPLRPLMDVFTR